MSELVAGLIGVIAGGIVTGAVHVFQTYQDRRLKRRVAARLIYGELVMAGNALRRIAEKGVWPDKPPDFLDARTIWYAQREAFAAAVGAVDWDKIASTFEYLVQLPVRPRPGKRLTKDEKTKLKASAERASAAADIALVHATPRRELKSVRAHLEEHADGEGS